MTFDGSKLALNGDAVSSLKSSVNGNSGAEIQVHPNGKFVYASNRGDDSIAIFSVGSSGTLTLKTTVKSGGKTPRHISLDSSGKWMTVSNESGTVNFFSVNSDSGALTAKGTPVKFKSAQFSQIVELD